MDTSTSAHLLDLQNPPADRDDAVAMLRWALAWQLDRSTVDEIAGQAGVDAGRIVAFLEAPAATAGECLAFAEAARLMRLAETRLEDCSLAGQADDHRRIAEPYIEAAGLDYGLALRAALEARASYRAANPEAAAYCVG